MDEPSHRAEPGQRPSRAQRREYYRTSTDRSAARNSMSVADYRTYASLTEDRTHPLRQPAGLLGLAIVMHEIPTTRRRKRESITWLEPGHSTSPDLPDPGVPFF